jgi:hypothetical protein
MKSFSSADFIYRAVYKVLYSLIQLHKEVVKLPPNYTLDEVADDLKRYPFFADCIRALDSTHLPVSIKGGYKRQAP